MFTTKQGLKNSSANATLFWTVVPNLGGCASRKGRPWPRKLFSKHSEEIRFEHACSLGRNSMNSREMFKKWLYFYMVHQAIKQTGFVSILGNALAYILFFLHGSLNGDHRGGSLLATAV